MKSSMMEDITLNSENIADKQQEAEGEGEDAQIKVVYLGIVLPFHVWHFSLTATLSIA
jgi:hypothetical protein